MKIYIVENITTRLSYAKYTGFLPLAWIKIEEKDEYHCWQIFDASEDKLYDIHRQNSNILKKKILK